MNTPEQDAQLLAELDQRALDRLVDTFALQDNAFRADCFTFTNHATNRLRTRIRFTLGGVEHDWMFEHDLWLGPGEKLAKIKAEIRDRLENVLVEAILSPGAPLR